MAAPVRYPSGVSVVPPRSVLSNYPSVPAAFQFKPVSDVSLVGTSAFTATNTGTSSYAPYSWNGGVVRFALGATAADSSYAKFNSPSFQVVPGNELWCAFNMALPSASLDVNVQCGLMDGNTTAVSNNGIYFTKAAGSTSVSLVIKKAGSVVATINNVADLAKNSGIFGDTTPLGTITANGAAGAYTSIAVGNPGGGYARAPMVIARGATGSGATGYAQLGSGTLYAPYLTSAGSAYTTFTFEVIPWVQLSFYYDGKDTLFIGVNGVNVGSIGPSGTLLIPTATLSSSVAPVPLNPGSVAALLPQVIMSPVAGAANTTANARELFIDGLLVAGEYN